MQKLYEKYLENERIYKNRRNSFKLERKKILIKIALVSLYIIYNFISIFLFFNLFKLEKLKI